MTRGGPSRQSSAIVLCESAKPDQFLRGRRIAITGAGRGLGRALAIIAADHGAETALLGRDPDALRAVADAIGARTGCESLVVPCDLGKPDSVASACETVLDDNPRVDALINNGAPWLEGRLSELSDTEIASTVAAAVSGTILVTKGLLPGLYHSNCADIITVVSTSGVPGWDLGGGSVPFYAAKHGQSGLSDKLRHELKGSGIRVSAIYPPDFDDADPTDSNWNSAPDNNANISSREIVSTLLFILATPRSCNFPVVILEGMSPATS
ncbi:MAG: SDR family NAD(P)-dependent oxidoreductase [Woeseiaceae bacterium]|nr:SDR family NAD(P)-dependent oxidoreductase [Woeseiaceae bacterium]